jgi:hypothetical protein
MARGKQECNPRFILAYLKAWKEAHKLNKRIVIDGFPNWYVSPIKEDEQ